MPRSMRCVLVVLAACSSSAKSEAPTAGKPTAEEKVPSASADPWAKSPPADPAADAAALRADVDVMCGAAKATSSTSFMAMGPYIAEHMKTGAKLTLFADYRTRTLDEIVGRMRALAAKAGVQQCETIDVLVTNDPRKHD